MNKHERRHVPSSAGAIKDIVFGVEDGVVTALGTVLGVGAAVSDVSIVIIAGVAALFAEAVSMFFGSYLSAKAEKEIQERNIITEREEIKEKPKMEFREMVGFYMRRGLTRTEAVKVIKRLGKEKFFKIMLDEEFGLRDGILKNPLRVATVFWLATMVGIMAVVPFAFTANVKLGITIAVGLSIGTLFIVGALKSRFTKRNWVISGAEMAAIGMVAAMVGFIVGSVFHVAA
ncbi:MAG: VIT1/CCC1 transporter family protein [Candidatus Aenigmarchaeota archaeon]|nr:VIT1/CCC1 transporter family protein [Candidatus Aenigmarchaeota archaeon]